MSMLRNRFAGILGSIVGANALGCGGDIRNGFEESLCSEGSVDYVRDINATEPTSYIAAKRGHWGQSGATFAVQQQGVCAPEAECLQLEKRGEDLSGTASGPFGPHVVITQAQELHVLLTPEEVQAFLGSIDTPSEAALMTFMAGYDINCQRKNVTKSSNGYFVYAETGNTCGGNITGYRLFVSVDGTVSERDSDIVEKGDQDCAIGRIPSGLCTEQEQRVEGHPVGVYFAEVAHLEAAAVAAFENLVHDLEHHGAPADLIRRAQAAVREETRHALLTRAIARKYGAEPRVPQVRRRTLRSLEELALDNAIEGLTRETFGALLAQHQALTATDPAIRKTMLLIAEDETGHAEFSAMLHSWLLGKLSEPQLARVRVAQASAIESFRTGAHSEAAPVLQELAGLPCSERSRCLYDALFPPAIRSGLPLVHPA